MSPLVDLYGLPVHVVSTPKRKMQQPRSYRPIGKPVNENEATQT